MTTVNPREVTPGRVTHVRFDLDEDTLREPPYALWRAASQMMKGKDGKALSQNVKFLETNAIVINSWNDDTSNLHQKTDTPQAILRAPDFNLVSGMAEFPTWRSPAADLLGVTVDSSVATTGDHFQRKTVAAGVTWNQSDTADISAYGQITPLGGYNVSMDRVAVGVTTELENQGLHFRMTVAASAPHAKQVLGSLNFGSFVTQTIDGSIPTGKYGIVFLGSGDAELWMGIDDGAGGTKFILKDTWQAFDRSASSQTVTCLIRPHIDHAGLPTILFATDSADGARQGNIVQSYYGTPQNQRVHVWHGNVSNGLPVTGAGAVRVDHPRDQRPPFQVGRIKHTDNGYVFDDPFSLDWLPTITNPMTLVWRAFLPDGCQLFGALYEYTSGNALPVLASGPGWASYLVQAGQYFYNAKFTLVPSPDGNYTPILYGYQVLRDGVYDTVSVGEWETVPREVSISGPDQDLTHETASLDIIDVTGSLTKLSLRAGIRTRIETEYDSSDSTKRAVLFDGYLGRADGKLMGTKSYEGFSQNSASGIRQYPSQQWKDFGCTFSGMWQRLRENLTMQRVYLTSTPDSGDLDANGQTQPPKVTDVCRQMLGWCGFSPAQIDVPDSPIRFFSQDHDSSTLQPLTEIGDAVAGFLHDYLGWFLIWDGNAGAAGMVRAIQPPPAFGPYTPLAKFTLDTPPVGFVHRPETYGSPGWYTTGTAGSYVIPTMFVRRKTFQTHVKPPEANAVHVTNTGLVLPAADGQYQGNQWAWNPKSYDFFVDASGSPIHTADPTDPDYLGRFVPVVVVNTAIGGGHNDPPNNLFESQHILDIFTRRLYDTVCRAQKWAMFEAPLALVIDPNDNQQRTPRPLRYYDAVTVTAAGVDTTWLVRSCNPSYRKDAIQLCHMELQLAPTPS